ncbi:MAG: hypothetical protein RBT44_00480 [Sphaerochaetaceae bacterium]|jgi:hypothetical protein|nr:hypothetical protein [Sphaerochaetaceae bacterium]
MNKKKRVFIMMMMFLVVASILAAGAIGRGGFGAGAVIGSSDVSQERPVQRWQSLDPASVESCPCLDGEFDAQEIAAWQDERAAQREENRSERMSGDSRRQGRNFSNQQDRDTANRRFSGSRPGMNGARGASFGPPWAR